MKNLFAKKPYSGGPSVFSQKISNCQKCNHFSSQLNSILQKGNLQFKQWTVTGDMAQNCFKKSDSTPEHATGDSFHIFKTDQITEIQ